MLRKVGFPLILIILLFIVIDSCVTGYYFRYNYREVNRLLHDNLNTKLFLKAHHKNGNVSILRDTWQVDTLQNILSGSGEQYDFNRNKINSGTLNIPLDSIALYETNKKMDKTENSRIISLALMAGLDVVVGVICLSNPKACFGSCPTFYMNENSHFHYADAEGFSNAILPSFEYGDIDALRNPPVTNGQFSLTMKNEALETHCVKEVKILAFPKTAEERIYHTPANEFYRCRNIYTPKVAQASEGNILPLISFEDRAERFSLSDETNLCTKEEIILDFGSTPSYSKMGLVLSFRQTLMTTYFIYSAMGYMGDEVGDIFSKLENGKDLQRKFHGSIPKELGGIDVFLWNTHKADWEWQHTFNETGPIAVNQQIVPLTNIPTSGETKIKLRLNKGLWRIDFAALTEIETKAEPVTISPTSILNKGKLDRKALSDMHHPTRHLISLPGDEYKFNFEMPDPSLDYELFLYSKGYYLEWMRASWIKDKDIFSVKKLLDSPKDFLEDETANYKRYETIMEEQFWNSKIDTKTFSYHGQ